MSYDIITFGSATQDIHIKSNDLNAVEKEGFFLPFGSKIELSDFAFTTGGGGTNTAATFAKQGFKTAFCGGIGVDLPGLEIVRELRHLKVDVNLVVKKKGIYTNSSIIFTNQGRDRIILTYRGASDVFSKDDIFLKRIKKAKWFYMAPLTGSMCENFAELVDFAKENNIKIAVNPSKEQLSLPEKELKIILNKVDVLFLNLEEASFLTKITIENEQEILKIIYHNFCKGIVVITRGGKGALVMNDSHIYSAGVNSDRKIIDTTGAGDSFASGFLSSYMRENNIEKAIQLGIANSEGNLSEIGAKTGLLKRGAEFKSIEVKKEII